MWPPASSFLRRGIGVYLADRSPGCVRDSVGSAGRARALGRPKPGKLWRRGSALERAPAVSKFRPSSGRREARRDYTKTCDLAIRSATTDEWIHGTNDLSRQETSEVFDAEDRICNGRNQRTTHPPHLRPKPL